MGEDSPLAGREVRGCRCPGSLLNIFNYGREIALPGELLDTCYLVNPSIYEIQNFTNLEIHSNCKKVVISCYIHYIKKYNLKIDN